MVTSPSTQLYIDFGNSAVKWCVLNSEVNQHTPVTIQGITEQRFHHQLSEHVIIEQICAAALDVNAKECWLSCVSDTPIKPLLVEALASGGTHVHEVQSASHFAGIDSDYEHPEKLGVDRLLAMLACKQALPNTDLIVVDVGTAITIDALTSRGKHLGGSILSGVPMLLAGLNRISQNQHVDWPAFASLQTLEHHPPRNTKEALNAGILHSIIGGTQHAIHTQKKWLSEPSVVISGGCSEEIKQAIASDAVVMNNSVLIGLTAYRHFICER